MKRKFKLPALLLSFLLFLPLVSCGKKNREYDAAVVEAAARTLIEKTVLLNEIYYGKGIPADIGSSEGSYKYKPADFIWLSQNGFSTIEELKEMTTKVYSNGYCNSIFASTFGSSAGADNTLEAFARYIQIYETEEPDVPKHILVDIYAEPLLVCENEYLYDTVKVTHSKGDHVYVSIDVKVTRPADRDGEKPKTEVKNLSFPLIEETNGWRIDGATFINIIP